MNREKDLLMLRELADANGAPGFEDEVLAVLRKHGQRHGDFSEDSLRNLYLTRKENTGNRPMVQLDAHTDEVGFMVQAITSNGALRFITLGGWVPSSVTAQKVHVRNDEGQYITGVVASKPPHYMTEEERKSPPRIEDMLIDIGATSRDEAINDFKIRIGAPIVPDAACYYNEEKDLLIGKAFDCRMGCAAVLSVLDALQGQPLDVDVTAGFAVQEEMGLRGATVTAQTIRPDIAIVFEGCPADDHFAEPHMIQTGLKRGPMLRHIDNRMITNPRFLRYTLDLAERLGIPVQEAVRAGGATNGGSIHLSGCGVPVIVIGLPVRYIHTHYGIASYSDYEKTVMLGMELVKALNEDIIKGF